MRILKTPRAVERRVAALRRAGRRVGFVPTMGYLHDGHLSLVRRARAENDAVVASIFVNPLQFGPREDLGRYPRDLRRDKALLAGAGVDSLFLPSVAAMYPEGFRTRVRVRGLGEPLCGRTRPTHFEGVATVVLKLLNLVRPDRLYLGQKDYQQFLLLKRMAEDLALPVTVRMVPIRREKDGLAMSSRNVYLTAEERRQAPALRRALGEALRELRRGGPSPAKAAFRRALHRSAPSARMDYFEIVHASDLSPVVQFPSRKSRRVLLAAAVYFGRTRLIDNLLARA
jgi:pantoate--beta-alanine ligase